MPNTPVPAAATGLPSASSSRRAFLGASIAAAVVARSGSAGAGEVRETPALAGAAQALAEARKTLIGATARLAVARMSFERETDQVPLELVWSGKYDLATLDLYMHEDGPDGLPMRREGWPGGRRILDAARCKAKADRYDSGSPRRRQLLRLARLAAAYEQRREAARAAAQFDRLYAAYWGALGEVSHWTDALAAVPCRTVEGVLVKLDAIEAAEGLPDEVPHHTRRAVSEVVADDLVRLLRGAT
ncbi:MAG: hypothetical protein FD152_4211 [Xanthobacteraceae bacterium]|nr:MAG: hypothetical protein FD152_4211 [Xanthobacteraceae bacterium]